MALGSTKPYLAAFETCDTQQKYSNGGKGIGRLAWAKVFENI
jgi:hypothetical protein